MQEPRDGVRKPGELMSDETNAPGWLLDHHLRVYHRSASLLETRGISISSGAPLRDLLVLGLRYIDPGQARDVLARLASNTAPENGRALPLLTWVARKFGEENVTFLNEVYGALVLRLRRLETRYASQDDLFAWDEEDRSSSLGRTGGDFGHGAHAAASVDLSSAMALEFASLAHIARRIGKYEEAAVWEDRHQHIAAAIDALLWDDEDRFYYNLNAEGMPVFLKRAECFLPLLARIPDGDRAEALRMHMMNPKVFWTPLPISAIAQDEPNTPEDAFFVHPFLNLLLCHGLLAYSFLEEARALAHHTINEMVRQYVNTGCLYDRYDCAMKRKPEWLSDPTLSEALVADQELGAAAVYVHLTHLLT